MDPLAIVLLIVVTVLVLSLLIWVGLRPPVRKSSRPGLALYRMAQKTAEDVAVEHIEKQFQTIGQSMAAPLTSFTVQQTAATAAPAPSSPQKPAA